MTGLSDSNGCLLLLVATTTTVTRVAGEKLTGSVILFEPAGVLTDIASEELELKFAGSSRFTP